MNITQIQKLKTSKLLIQFQQLTCKQQSSKSYQALSNLISTNPDQSSQFLRISMVKDRLDLIYLNLKSYTPSQPLKIITYLCKGMNMYNWKQISSIWNLLYIQDKSNYKYQIYYECLASLIFGGANKISQSNSLHILYQLINIICKRQDNKLLCRIIDNFLTNFMIYNILNGNYFRVMNQMILMAKNYQGYVNINVYELLNRYVIHLKKAKQKKQHNLETQIIVGIGYLGDKVLNSSYIIGSFHQGVIHHLEPYLQNKIFGVRSAARDSLSTWRKVQKRIKNQRQQKLKLVDYQDLGYQFNPLSNINQTKYINQPKVKNMIDQTNKYLIKKQYVEKKLLNQLLSVQQSINKKQYLKKKTGNGGGFIKLQNNSKMKINKTKYEQVITNVLNNKKEIRSGYEKNNEQIQILQQYSWYPNNSHLTSKYNLQQTIQYQNRQEQYMNNVMSTQSKINLNSRQIQQLIDLAYAKMW